jgi:hypothetical protein
MPSNIEIANLALSSLGAKLLSAFDEDTENGNRVNAIYTIVRDIMLAKHPWNFAIKQAALALLDETPLYGFDNVFQLPDDYIRVVSIEDLTQNVDYKIKGKKLYIDDTTVNIEYVHRVTDPLEFSQGFIDAFADEIAQRLAFSITGSKTTARDAFQKAKFSLNVAKAQDAQEGFPDQLDGNELLNVRNG